MSHVFDSIADWVAARVAQAPFFAFCIGLVAAWLLQGLALGLWTNDLWHLELNSPTTAITFLLVALLHNTSHRASRALTRKVDLILEATRTHCDDPDLCSRMDDLIGTEATSSKEE